MRSTSYSAQYVHQETVLDVRALHSTLHDKKVWECTSAYVEVCLYNCTMRACDHLPRGTHGGAAADGTPWWPRHA